jgi:hypothetical protein
MSLTKEYIDEVMDNLAFFKNTKRPCQINFASGQELIHNILNLKRGPGKVEIEILVTLMDVDISRQ